MLSLFTSHHLSHVSPKVRDHLHTFVGQSLPSFSSTVCFQSFQFSFHIFSYLPGYCRAISPFLSSPVPPRPSFFVRGCLHLFFRCSYHILSRMFLLSPRVMKWCEAAVNCEIYQTFDLQLSFVQFWTQPSACDCRGECASV